MDLHVPAATLKLEGSKNEEDGFSIERNESN